MAAAQADIGGHTVNLKSALKPMFRCPFCDLLIRDAVQTYRGERACHSCYYDAKGKRDDNMCPIDKEAITDEEIFNDIYARRELLQLPIYCNNKHNGCVWEGVVIDITNHLLQCPFEYIPCALCTDCVMRKDTDDHIEHACRLRPLNCDYCNDIFQAQFLSEHEPICPRRPTQCPYVCGEHIPLEGLYSHVQHCSKVGEGVVCPYQLIGCKWRYTLEHDETLDGHLERAAHVHAALTVSNVEYLKESNRVTREELLSEQGLREQLSRQVEGAGAEKRSMGQNISMLEGKLCDLQRECDEMRGTIKKGVEKVKEDVKEIDTLTQANNLREINEKLEAMSAQMNQLEDKVMSTHPDGHGRSEVNTEEMKGAIAKIDEIENNSAVLSANLADLELKLQLLENTSYDGRQLWKIDNVEYRRSQAVTGKVTALHSAPWHQGRGQYKFCARLYLNGDGMGRGTHVSLFFVLMKSEYDALLKWPFEQRVTFRLINPYNQEESLQESFIPDKNSSSFKRPARDMNIAAGCPMFIRKEEFSRFIIDDVIFIEIKVSPP